MIFQVPGYLTKLESRSLGGWVIKVETQEIIDPDSIALFAKIKQDNKPGWFMFKQAAIDKDDVLALPDLKPIKGKKSPSQRLRAALYVLYKKIHTDGDRFEEYYDSTMEKFIDMVKEKLQ